MPTYYAVSGQQSCIKLCSTSHGQEITGFARLYNSMAGSLSGHSIALQIKEDLVRLLLPYLMAGLAASVTADYRAATLMILTQLASQATLSDTLLAGEQLLSSLSCDVFDDCAHYCNADDDSHCKLTELLCSLSYTSVCIP